MRYRHKNGITLRKIGRDDLGLLLRLKEESWFGTHRVAILNETDQASWFESVTKSSTDLFLMAEGGDHNSRLGLFKVAGIDWMNRSAHVAWDVFSEHRGQGYGKKVVEAGTDLCFEIQNLHRLDLEILLPNEASHKCALYAGYYPYGKRKAAIYKCGQYVDSWCLGLLAEEWNLLGRVETLRNQSPSGTCNLNYTWG